MPKVVVTDRALGAEVRKEGVSALARACQDVMRMNCFGVLTVDFWLISLHIIDD